MKILTGKQIRRADEATIIAEGIESIELMERAAEAIAGEICQIVSPDQRLVFMIGKGHNGGDGLAVARILYNAGFDCTVLMIYPASTLTSDSCINFERLPNDIKILETGKIDIEKILGETDIVIDAILGSGLKGPAKDEAVSVIEIINNSGVSVISIDIPSGMPTEPQEHTYLPIVRATHTLTIGFPKLSMLLPDTGEDCGRIHVVDIDLDPEFTSQSETNYHIVTEDFIVSHLKDRSKFSHKGDFGHALLICGSSEMFGAAILSTSAALRSGCGLVTSHIPRRLAAALYASTPSAMVSLDEGNCFTSLPRELDKYTVCGTGCGLGKSDLTVTALERLMRAFNKPMVIDADALNIISDNPSLKQLIPAGSVLTPHPGEFKRFVGQWNSDAEKLSKLRALSVELASTVILKGAYTAVCTPQGQVYFNPTGSPAMAKGGSGDVLTGFVTGLIARGYTPEEAAVIGVYLHGKGGEKAAGYYGTESVNSSDLPDFIAEAYNELYTA